MKEIARLSPSIAKILLERSPLHAWQAHRLLGGGNGKSSKAMDKGHLIEAAMGLGDMQNIVVIEADSFRTKAAQEARDEAIALGRTAVLAKDYAEAQETAGKLVESLAKKGIVLKGEHQVRLEWNSPSPHNPMAPGVACSGVLDLFDKGTAVIVDLKTTENANPKALQRKMVDYGYDIQAAAYIEAVETLFPELAGRVIMRFLFVETEAPYCVTPVELAGTMRELGQRKWKRAVEEWGMALATNRWRDYTAGIVRLEALPWQLDQDITADLEAQDRKLDEEA